MTAASHKAGVWRIYCDIGLAESFSAGLFCWGHSSRKEKEILNIFLQNGTENDEKVTPGRPKSHPGVGRDRMRFWDRPSPSGAGDFL